MAIKGKVTVVWLDPGEVCSDFAVSVCDIFRVRSDIISGRVVVRSGGGITRGRNRAINEFLSGSDDDWALMVDADMKFTVDDFNLLVHHAHERKVPVVGGLCFAQDGYHAGPFATLVPTIFHKHPELTGYLPMYDYPRGQLVECDATGAAFLLVHRSVFEKIAKMTGLGRWSWFHEGPTEDLTAWSSEDVTFCELIKAAGFPIFVHTGARIGHVKGIDYTLTEEMFDLLRAAARPRVDS